MKGDFLRIKGYTDTKLSRNRFDNRPFFIYRDPIGAEALTVGA